MKSIKDIIFNSEYWNNMSNRVNDYDLEQLRKWEEENEE